MGLTDVRTSINRRQNTVAQYIATRPLLDLCEGSEAERGSAGYAKVVGPVGHRLGEGQGEGHGDGIGVRFGFGVRHGGGGGAGNIYQGKQIKWGGMEQSKCG